MRNIDLTPLYRSFIGADHMANLLDSLEVAESGGFPPYDIEVIKENQYRITLAVAGFSRNEISIEQESNQLRVSGVKEVSSSDANYLHQGIAKRNFERRFQHADHVEVRSADYRDGLLHINLAREIPEAMKPRKIEIGQEASGESLSRASEKETELLEG